jgi:hypothetical protein
LSGWTDERADKAALVARRFAALTPASLWLDSQCGSRWLPLLDKQKRLSSSATRSR